MSLIRGWVCQAGRVEVSLDGGLLLATAYGTERLDTAGVCGDTNNGFGLTYNWNRAGDGVHTLQAFADGVEFATVNFAVTTLGSEYLTGLEGEYTVPDFPAAGKTAKLRWSESHQNFVVVNPITIPPVNNPPAGPGAALESPTQGSSESGVGLIRGWVCQAGRVEVSIDGGPLMLTAYGTERLDTATVCGDTNNGFGLTYNWNRAGDGVHNLRALADGVEFANVNFAVTTLGGEYLTGLSNKFRLFDFPRAGTAAAAQAGTASSPTTTLQWSEPEQNFLIATTTATGEKLALVSAVTDLRNRFAVLGLGTGQTESTGAHVDKDAAGAPTRLDGVTWTEPATGRWTDLGLNAEGLPASYRDSNGLEARFSQFGASSVVVEFFDAAGKSLGGPVTTPLDVGLVRKLQELANRIGAAAPVVAPPAPLEATPAGFSLKPLLAELFATGGGAEGELLCAVQAAGVTAGVSNLIAPFGCQSPLLKGLLALVTRPSIQADTPTAAGPDPALQQAFEFSTDVPEAPCETSDASAACLNPATAVLQARAAVPVPEVPPDSSSSPTSFTVTTSVVPNGTGTISPSFQQVDRGNTASFTVEPASGYQIVSVTGCGGSRNGTGLPYTYTTAPITADCTVSASFSPIIPDPPTGVAASDGVFFDKVGIGWNAAPGATSYELYRSTSAGGMVRLYRNITNIYAYDSTVTPGGLYYYSVKSCNSSGCSSGFSNTDSGYASLSPPTGATARCASESQIIVSWNAVSGAVGYYNVLRYENGRGSSAWSVTTTSMYDSVPLYGTTYSYTVSACSNAVGCGPASSISNGISGCLM